MTDARLELEATFACPQCNGVPYKLYRRSTAEHPEVFTHVLWPTDPSLPPPVDTKHIRCPVDGADLRRMAA